MTDRTSASNPDPARPSPAHSDLARSAAAPSAAADSYWDPDWDSGSTPDSRPEPLFDPFAAGSFAPSLEQSEAAGQAHPRPIDFEAADAKGLETAHKVRDAMRAVTDPELGIDVVDLGLLYGVRVDAKGRAILTMTLTTPACPLTELIEDEAAIALAPVVEYYRVDWVWEPQWNLGMITPKGRSMLNAIGYNF